MKTRSVFTKIIFFSGIYLSFKAEKSASSVLKNTSTINSDTAESLTDNQQTSTITGRTNSEENIREENGEEKSQDSLGLNNFVEKLNDKIEVKFDEATAQLHSINHRMNMIDSKVNLKLEKLSNLVDGVDQKLDEKLTSRTAYTTTTSPRPHHKWGRKLLKYSLIVLSTIESLRDIPC